MVSHFTDDWKINYCYTGFLERHSVIINFTKNACESFVGLDTERVHGMIGKIENIKTDQYNVKKRNETEKISKSKCQVKTNVKRNIVEMKRLGINDEVAQKLIEKAIEGSSNKETFISNELYSYKYIGEIGLGRTWGRFEDREENSYSGPNYWMLGITGLIQGVQPQQRPKHNENANLEGMWKRFNFNSVVTYGKKEHVKNALEYMINYYKNDAKVLDIYHEEFDINNASTTGYYPFNVNIKFGEQLKRIRNSEDYTNRVNVEKRMTNRPVTFINMAKKSEKLEPYKVPRLFTYPEIAAKINSLQFYYNFNLLVKNLMVSTRKGIQGTMVDIHNSMISQSKGWYCQRIECSKWDAHVSGTLLLIENYIKVHCCNNETLKKYFTEEMKEIYSCLLIQKNGNIYNVGEKRMSGTFNTSCGNKIINHFQLTLVLSELGILGLSGFVKIEGDDGLLIQNSRVIDPNIVIKKAKEIYAAFGHKEEFLISTDFSEPIFCSHGFKIMENGKPWVWREEKVILEKFLGSKEDMGGFNDPLRRTKFFGMIMSMMILYWANKPFRLTCIKILDDNGYKKASYDMIQRSMETWKFDEWFKPFFGNRREIKFEELMGKIILDTHKTPLDIHECNFSPTKTPLCQKLYESIKDKFCGVDFHIHETTEYTKVTSGNFKHLKYDEIKGILINDIRDSWIGITLAGILKVPMACN